MVTPMALLRIVFLIILGLQQSCITLNGLTMPKFPAVLVFGDSAVDTGNNDYINSIFKANYPPYGMNYPGHVPTGRYSDGKLTPDFLASLLGIKEAVPPFLQPNLSSHELLTGVCFASAGSGLDDQTTALSNSIPMSKQPDLFRQYLFMLNQIVAAEEAQRIVRDAVVIIHAGTVDLMYNFYILRSNRMLQFTLSGYQDFLQSNLEKFLKELYDHGCRRMVVCGLPPIGCMPLLKSAQFQPFSSTCLANVNSDVQSYNQKLEKLLPQAQAKLPGSKILYADTFNPLMDMITNPKKYGFQETARGCCGSGIFEGNQWCNFLTPLCPNPSQNIWFDSVHPTEAVYRHLSIKLLPQLALF